MHYKQALNKAAALCSQQERCIDDIRKKITNWDLEDDEADKAIAWLIDEKFIDEKRYASYYVKDKFRFNGWGRIKIRWQLKQKKIPDHIIDEALYTLDENDYIQKLAELLRGKKKQIKDKDIWKTKAALARFAQSRGFEPDIIFRTIDKIVNL